MNEATGPTKLTGAKQIAYCTCMQSAHWPHCDATHHTAGGSGPKIIELDEEKRVILKNKNPIKFTTANFSPLISVLKIPVPTTPFG